MVAPNSKARRMGMAGELRVGWKHNFNNVVHWWGSCADRAAIKRLLENVRSKYGDIRLEERESDV